MTDYTKLFTPSSLICAGWLPHDNRFVGELPRSIVEDHSIAGRLIGIPRILPPLPILLPTHCMTMIFPLRFYCWLRLPGNFLHDFRGALGTPL